MARLVDFPRDMGINGLAPTNGPLVSSSGATQGASNYLQSFSRVGFRWELEVTIPPLQGRAARQFRGWVLSMQGGASATRYKVIDQHKIKHSDYGLQKVAWGYGMPWSNGTFWPSRQQWGLGHPVIQLTEAFAKGATDITLPSEYWGHALEVGDEFGFVGTFAKHMVTEVYEEGSYRVFPPLRKAQEVGDFATLHPVLALRMPNAGAATMRDQPAVLVDGALTLVEVLHDEVVKFYE